MQLEELTHGKETIELTILADETSVKQVLSDFSDIDDVNWLECQVKIAAISRSIQTKIHRKSVLIFLLNLHRQKMPVTQMFVNKATLGRYFPGINRRCNGGDK